MVTTAPFCQVYSPDIGHAFGYKPSLAPGIIFFTLFFLSSSIRAIQAFRYKAWWGYLFAIGAGAECLGWIARTAASECSYSTELFKKQISLLIFALAWTTAGLYIMIPMLGKRSSPSLQKHASASACGGLAGRSFSANVNTSPGTLTMVAGILFQLASTITYSILMSIVFSRGFPRLRSSKAFMRLAAAMVVVVCCMIARGVYRSIELLQGWSGYLNTHEQYITGLDGSLMVLAVLLLNFCNPGMLLGVAEKERQEKGLKDGSDGEKEAKRGPSEDSSIV